MSNWSLPRWALYLAGGMFVPLTGTVMSMKEAPAAYFVVAVTTATMTWFSCLLGFGALRTDEQGVIKYTGITALCLFLLAVLGYLVASTSPTASLAWSVLGIILTLFGTFTNALTVSWVGNCNGVADGPRRIGMLAQAALPVTLLMWPSLGPVALAISLGAMFLAVVSLSRQQPV